VFELLKPTQMMINVEFKTGKIYYEGIEAKALKAAVKFDITKRIVWSSFNHYSVQKLKQLDKNAETALLSGGELFVTGEQCEKTGAAALHPHLKQLRYPGLVEECHKRGVKVRAWTINEPEDFQLARDLSIDGIITNRIDLAKNS
jgi:glycerophosphoryl diester phosphodiesterase